MSGWTARRFWTDAVVERGDAGFEIRLDGRPVNTPGKRRLVLPTEAMANHVAAEWQAQEKVIDPLSMPWTRSANSAVDKVAPQMAAVADHLAEYAATDLVSYRADAPDDLIRRQAQVWDPLLARVAGRYDVSLLVTSGIMPVTQPPEVLERLRAIMQPMTAFELTGFHDLVTLPGSFVIGLNAINDWAPLEDLWQAGRLDELYQIEQWGEDEEAEKLAEAKRRDFHHAAAVFRASR